MDVVDDLVPEHSQDESGWNEFGVVEMDHVGSELSHPAPDAE
jgi:hypothetical protein